MAKGKPGRPRLLGPGPDSKRELFLQLIVSGLYPYAACESIGISTRVYTEERKRDPEFAEAVQAALEVSNDPIFDVIRKEALKGDMRAAELYLKHRAPTPVQRTEVTVESNTGAADAESVAELLSALQERAALPEAIEDAEIIEDDS